jgi:hypothetical protein
MVLESLRKIVNKCLSQQEKRLKLYTNRDALNIFFYVLYCISILQLSMLIEKFKQFENYFLEENNVFNPFRTKNKNYFNKDGKCMSWLLLNFYELLSLQMNRRTLFFTLIQ